MDHYNGTGATGGDSRTVNLNQRYNPGDMAWILASTALVWLMIPGVGFFYSGLARRKSALSLILLTIMSTAVVSFQASLSRYLISPLTSQKWFFWGYSLAFSHSAGLFIGDLANFGFKGVLGRVSVGSPFIPDALYAVYQLMFACITPALAIGAASERGRLLPCIVFIFVWSTLVYDVIACWTWNPSGWMFKMGSIDFAGGSPVHISSGSAALAYSLMLGKRHGHGTNELNFRPHNVTHVALGTALLWFGWFGFNGGSAGGANLRAVSACIVTNLAASTGAITWVLLDLNFEKKWTTVGFCSGAVAGLVAITPGSGFVPPWTAVIFGILGSAACNYATKIKYWLGIDDALDIFAIHGIGGLVGNIFGIFAADYIAALDGVTVIPGGWLNHHWIQLGYQLADSMACMAYSFVVTCIILFIMNLIPGLSLRVPIEGELAGIDDYEGGEFAYDYVENERDYRSRADLETSILDVKKADDGARAIDMSTLHIDKSIHSSHDEPPQ
ncbi:Ammonium transporter 1 [Neolecta irregularis DAH-3]|uniref:Ammonium transporter n=1 Tax=Neolecta irregularis (strain DAH-3) TaxID=1198029 RepID=A0A1U7LSF0_NEOID|nr:Ammonium transporter 1 [Neolecta irregularis DAH-3]|eukprot:OLL25574.1 Ammonium transporter 1 [Neolecta irregularis DAH-3]